MPALVAQLDAYSTRDQKVAGSTPLGRQHSSMEIDHPSTDSRNAIVILGERMCTILV